MAMASKHGLMVRSMKVIMCTVKSTAMEDSPGLTVALTMGNSKKTIFKARELITGRTAGSSLARGLITRWKDQEFSHGPTAESMMESTSTTRKKVKELFIGRTAESMSADGKMESKMELAIIHLQVEKKRKENGRRENVCNGFLDE